MWPVRCWNLAIFSPIQGEKQPRRVPSVGNESEKVVGKKFEIAQKPAHARKLWTLAPEVKLSLLLQSSYTLLPRLTWQGRSFCSMKMAITWIQVWSLMAGIPTQVASWWDPNYPSNHSSNSSWVGLEFYDSHLVLCFCVARRHAFGLDEKPWSMWRDCA